MDDNNLDTVCFSPVGNTDRRQTSSRDICKAATVPIHFCTPVRNRCSSLLCIQTGVFAPTFHLLLLSFLFFFIFVCPFPSSLQFYVSSMMLTHGVKARYSAFDKHSRFLFQTALPSPWNIAKRYNISQLAVTVAACRLLAQAQFYRH